MFSEVVLGIKSLSVKMYVRRCTGFQHLVLNLGQKVDRQRSTTVSSLKQ